MPGVSGTEILAAVRDQDPETPVILMTAQASLQTAIQAVNEGAFYYIQKPFSNDDMVAISAAPRSIGACGRRTSSSNRKSAAASAPARSNRWASRASSAM